MTLSTEQVEAAARQLIDGRMQAVRDLAAARATTKRAQAALADAQRADAQAWAAAERAGWTAAELQKVGFSKPATRTPGRPRKGRTTDATQNTDPTPAPAEQPASH